MPALPIRPTVLALSMACDAASVPAAEPAADPLAGHGCPGRRRRAAGHPPYGDAPWSS